MSYETWETAINAAAITVECLQARVWNLKHETRLETVIQEVQQQLGDYYAKRCGDGLVPEHSAILALDQVLGELANPTHRWLGLIPVGNRERIPNQVFTHLPLKDVYRYSPSGPINLENPPRSVRLDLPLKMVGDAASSRFIWITFDALGNTPTDNPTQLVKELGLAHCVDLGFMYRVTIDVSGCKLFIPSCLDAGLYEAWAPPRIHNPWGMTRDLETGASAQPELLTETVEHAATRYSAVIVSPPGTWVKIGVIRPNFMVGRDEA